MQGKCTSVLVETEKNAHSQSNAVSFAVTISLSGLTGSELRLFKNLSLFAVSQKKIDKFAVSRIFCLYSIVALENRVGMALDVATLPLILYREVYIPIEHACITLREHHIHIPTLFYYFAIPTPFFHFQCFFYLYKKKSRKRKKKAIVLLFKI